MTVDNRRILIIDDNEQIHQDISKILCPPSPPADLHGLKADILGSSAAQENAKGDFQLDSAFQGEEAVEMVRQAMAKGKPYAMAFIDVRMPPGMDGIETISALHKCDPDLGLVIITAYSDYSWKEIAEKNKDVSNLFILKKPFESIEIHQFASALTEKWNMNKKLASSMDALSREKENLTTIMNCMEDGAYICDKQYHIIYTNPVVEREFGQAEGKLCYSYFHEREDICPWCKHEQVYTGKSSRQELFFTKNNKTYDLIGTLYRTTDGKEGRLQIMRDITQQKAMENKLLRAQKHETATIFANGLSHDFNNLLSIIIGYAELAIDESESSSELHAMVQEIAKSSHLAKKLVSKFLTLSSMSQPGKTLFPLKRLILAALALSVDEDLVQCDTHCPDDLWEVILDPAQMGQVFANIFKNAAEAIDHDGTILIRAENSTNPVAYSKVEPPLPKGKYVKIVIKDTGKGITAENLAKIFDPYFSTKERSTIKGMGLGLATAYAIIHKHDGHIMVDSTPGKGTTVRIFLPVSPGE